METSTYFDNARTFCASNVLQIAMPMGGIGAGCICLNGYGGLQDFSIRNRPAMTAMPDGHGSTNAAFALLHIKGKNPQTRLVEGPLPVEKIYNLGLKGQGYREGGHEGLPRFQSNVFDARYPFGRVRLEDERLPICVSITGWSPFIPRDDINSGLPCAILEYTFVNRSSESLAFELSYHASHMAAPGGSEWKETRSSRLQSPAGSSGGGIHFTNTAHKFAEDHGSAAIYAIGYEPRIKAMWFRGGWFDAISVLWSEASTGSFTQNDGGGVESPARNGGSLLISADLAPHESLTIPIVIAWHFPNSNQRIGGAQAAPQSESGNECGPGCACESELVLPAWSPFYASKWNDAGEVALYVAENYASLRSRTQAFNDALFSSTLPAEVIDAVSSNLAILKSPTVLRQKNGNLWGWEGCFAESGCCPGSCTHVWNYAQSIAHLFPALERSLREQELLRSIDQRGHVTFRSAIPDGATTHDFHAAADGQLGGILKLYRDFQIGGDRDWLTRLYPQAKRSLDYCIEVWDPDRRGLLFEPHHNTYDIEFWGPDGMCSSVYIAALSAFAKIARALGEPDSALPYEDLASRGARLMDDTLFNGEYYAQKVMWRESRDASLRDQIAAGDPANDESLRLLDTEGPKYQYGAGCLADGIIGGWMAKIYGVDTPLDAEHIRSTLAAIFRYNFKPSLFDHACLQRPGYAIGHEAGLLLCTWPRGDKLTLPFPYSDEVWTGIEYQVASHLIEEGMVEDGLTIVRGARCRYDGRTRNPFNEYECGNYYARAMSSYALFGSLSGFRYSAPDRALWFAPKLIERSGLFRTFFSTESGFGTIELEGRALTIHITEGELIVRRVILTLGEELIEVECELLASTGSPAELTV